VVVLCGLCAIVRRVRRASGCRSEVHAARVGIVGDLGANC